MDISCPTPLLGGLSPRIFMRRHWQKKPLLIRQALPEAAGFLSRRSLFELAARDTVESRLVVHDANGWSLRHGPFARRALPALARPRWTLLVQGLDLHLDAAHELRKRFRFVPDARLDDLMVSWASDGGGVGPHVDSYDVFLLQVHGVRRWRIGQLADARLEPGVPLKILSNFVAEDEWRLEPGDLLYLPPNWAHDGVAEGECMTASIGFRSPGRAEIAGGVLQYLLEAAEPPAVDRLYRDPAQAATAEPGRIPSGLSNFAAAAVERLLEAPRALDAALGEWLTEPKPGVCFDAGSALPADAAAVLDRRSRMAYDERHVFINGESLRAAGRDATLMRRLADARRLGAHERRLLSAPARGLLGEWAEAGWVRAEPDA